MVEIAICDDNEKDQDGLKIYIAEYMDVNNISYTISTYKTGEEFLESKKVFHIIFLDMDMGDGINGIAVGKYIGAIKRKTKIIYTTRFYQYIEQDFNKVHAFAYLNKLVMKDKINSFSCKKLSK